MIFDLFGALVGLGIAVGVLLLAVFVLKLLVGLLLLPLKLGWWLFKGVVALAVFAFVGVVLLTVLGPVVGIFLPLVLLVLLLPALIFASIVGACAP